MRLGKVELRIVRKTELIFKLNFLRSVFTPQKVELILSSVLRLPGPEATRRAANMALPPASTGKLRPAATRTAATTARPRGHRTTVCTLCQIQLLPESSERADPPYSMLETEEGCPPPPPPPLAPAEPLLATDVISHPDRHIAQPLCGGRIAWRRSSPPAASASIHRPEIGRTSVTQRWRSILRPTAPRPTATRAAPLDPRLPP